MSELTKSAVFMGAGASRPFGYPLTSGILPEIRRHLKNRTTLFGGSKRSQSAIQDLKSLLLSFLPGFEDDSLELPLITDVLSLIDHSLAGGRMLIRGKTSSDLAYLRTLLERAMLNVIENGEPYEDKEERVLDAFCQWLSGDRNGGRRPAGIVSTNYDIAVERELFARYGTHQGVSKDFDFGFRWRDPDYPRLYRPPENPVVRFYKLHGSLNWLRCESCEHIYINTQAEISDLAFERVTDYNTCDCGHAPLSTVLVAPSLVRDIRDPNLLAIWEHALELLRTADEWTIIGYSLPPEDIAIRSLLIRAYNARGEKEPPRIRVVQLGESNDVRSRYKLFFPGCEYRTDGLEGLLKLK